MVIVIPACRDTQLLLCLMALQRCALPNGDVDIIVVVYDSETDAPELRALNLSIAADAERWAARINNTRRWFHIVHHCGMPRRDAGPDLARKIGMDEACRRLEQAGNPQGIIACLTSESRCAPNFLVELERHFQLHPQCPACSIYFEYPLNGAEYPVETYSAASNYELSLRYFVEVQRYAGYPYAFHTQAPGMALRCDAYEQSGGMYIRPVEEGSTFLNKFTDSPYFLPLNTTCIYISPPHHKDGINSSGQSPVTDKKGRLKTHAFQTFEDLRQLFQNAHHLYDQNYDQLLLPEVLLDFSEEVKAWSKISELRHIAQDPSAFKRLFFAWFNHQIIKQFALFARDHYYPDIPLTNACEALLTAQGASVEMEPSAMLLFLRRRDRNLA